MKTISLPLEEYNELLAIQEDSKNSYKKQREEIESRLSENYKIELNNKDGEIYKYKRLYTVCKQAFDDSFTKVTSYHLDLAPKVSVFNLKAVKEYHLAVQKKIDAVYDGYSIYNHYKNCLDDEVYGIKRY